MFDYLENFYCDIQDNSYTIQHLITSLSPGTQGNGDEPTSMNHAKSIISKQKNNWKVTNEDRT